jgi:hypothetical protein
MRTLVRVSSKYKAVECRKIMRQELARVVNAYEERQEFTLYLHVTHEGGVEFIPDPLERR